MACMGNSAAHPCSDLPMHFPSFPLGSRKCEKIHMFMRPKNRKFQQVVDTFFPNPSNMLKVKVAWTRSTVRQIVRQRQRRMLYDNRI